MVNNVIIFLLIIFDVSYFVMDIDFSFINILSNIIFISILFVPKLFIRYINNRLEFIYLMFVFLAYLIGIIMHLYNYLYWYDSFVHFLSGIVSSIIAMVILKIFKKENNYLFNIIFIFSFCLMIAGAWEIFEFILSKIIANDMQNVLTTGVNDTMKDMICALLGFVIYIIIGKKLN